MVYILLTCKSINPHGMCWIDSLHACLHACQRALSKQKQQTNRVHSARLYMASFLHMIDLHKHPLFLEIKCFLHSPCGYFFKNIFLKSSLDLGAPMAAARGIIGAAGSNLGF